MSAFTQPGRTSINATVTQIDARRGFDRGRHRDIAISRCAPST
jgi:hypothetical protein